MKFQPSQHGIYHLNWSGDILHVRYEGSWNEIASKNLHQDAKKLWEERGNKSWGLISDASNWDGATADALDVWWLFFEDATKHGMIAATDILSSQIHESIVSPLAERAKQLVHYQRSKTLDNAYTWLSSFDLYQDKT